MVSAFFYNIKTTVEKRLESDLAQFEVEINALLSQTYQLNFIKKQDTEAFSYIRPVWINKGGRTSRNRHFNLALDVLTKGSPGVLGYDRLNDLVCESILDKLGLNDKSVTHTLIPLYDWLMKSTTPYRIMLECPNGFELRADSDENVTFNQAIFKISLRK